MKFDLHVHTTLSPDSEISPLALRDLVLRAGLSGVAVCDHNVFGNLRGEDGIYIIPACEVSSDMGHLLVYFLKSDICKKMKKNEKGVYSWREVMKYAHAEGAVVFLAHPFAPFFPRCDDFWEELDGVEAFNARIVHYKAFGGNKKAFRLWKKLGLPFSAGSDAHSEKEIGRAFWECDIPEEEMSTPDFEEKLKQTLLSSSGRIFTGYSSLHTVFSCRRRIYKKQKRYKKFFKNFFVEAYVFLRSLILGKEEKRFIDIYTEE